MSYKLEDVAKLAGVSKTTVSRVLNNRGYLSQKTIDNVYQAMSQLNYQPNAAAQQLQKKKHILSDYFSLQLRILFLVSSWNYWKKSYISKDIQ